MNMTIYEIVNDSGAEMLLDAIKDWARLDSRNSIAACGVGQNREEMRKAQAAWEALGEQGQSLYGEILNAFRHDLRLALQEWRDNNGAYATTCGDLGPETVLGADYIGFDYLPSHLYHYPPPQQAARKQGI